MTASPPPFRVPTGVGVFLAAFCFFLLTGSRERPWADARPLWEVADAIADRGELSISTRWPGNLSLGHDGKVYGVAPLLQGLVHLPGAVLHRFTLSRFESVPPGLSWATYSRLASALMAALCCLLFLRLGRLVPITRGATLLGCGVLAVATIIWVYARYPYSEALQAACFTGFFAQALAFRRSPAAAGAVLVGVWSGLVVSAKLTYAVAVPGAAVWLLWQLRHLGGPRLARFTALAVAGALPFVALIAWYNQARWGSPFVSGYQTSGVAENPLVGTWGLFLSPGKSIFLFSPPLVVSALALPGFARRHRSVFWLGVAVLVPVVLVNASFQHWSGDYAWGPRYLVFAVPVLLLPALDLIERVRVRCRPREQAMAAAVLGLVAIGGVGVQVVGNAFYWDHFIRLQREVRAQWLGAANSAGSAYAPPGGGVCAACFEDMHGLQWLPPFGAIEGHAWLLPHVWRGDSWAQAQLDAPWRRYTTLALADAVPYERVRLDWWYYDFRDAHPRVGAWLLFTLLSGLMLGLLCVWLGRGRRGRA